VGLVQEKVSGKTRERCPGGRTWMKFVTFPGRRGERCPSGQDRRRHGEENQNRGLIHSHEKIAIQDTEEISEDDQSLKKDNYQ